MISGSRPRFTRWRARRNRTSLAARITKLHLVAEGQTYDTPPGAGDGTARLVPVHRASLEEITCPLAVEQAVFLEIQKADTKAFWIRRENYLPVENGRPSREDFLTGVVIAPTACRSHYLRSRCPRNGLVHKNDSFETSYQLAASRILVDWQAYAINENRLSLSKGDIFQDTQAQLSHFP